MNGFQCGGQTDIVKCKKRFFQIEFRLGYIELHTGDIFNKTSCVLIDKLCLKNLLIGCQNDDPRSV